MSTIEWIVWILFLIVALRETCSACGQDTIPRRILGFYVGSPQRVKIWECRECNFLWSEKVLPFVEANSKKFGKMQN